MKVVIMAGGRGTRIASVNSEVPKPMIPLAGKPVLQYQIEALKAQDMTEITLVTGYLGHVIEEYFGDGAKFGVTLDYVREKEPLGTAGALYFFRNLREDLLLLNGDIVFDADVARFYAAHRAHGGLATVFTHPNSHPYDSGVIVADGEGRVTQWLHKEDARLWYKNRVNAGLHFLSPALLRRMDRLEKRDLDREVLKPLVAEGELFVYDSPEYVKDMGTPDRYVSVTEDIVSGKVRAKNLKRKQKAIFLDRDGTINKLKGFLTSLEDFELAEGAAEAVKSINESGYLAVVATNQPVIARGEMSLEELAVVHNKMETLLGQGGAYLDGIYFCPHHPDKGFKGERPEFKIDCDCRKPKAGLLLRAAADLNIDLSQSWMIGDDERDLLCGIHAGCKTALIGRDERADVCGDSLLDCVRKIFGGNHEHILENS